MYQLYDISTWNRRHVYEFFQSYADPYVNVTVDIDVTMLYNYCKKNGLGFSYAALWIAAKLCNEIENFRLRQVGDELRLYDEVHIGQTIAFEDGTYTHGFLRYHPEMVTFCKQAKAYVSERLHFPGQHDERCHELDVIHSSITRWFKFTSMKDPRPDNQDSFPKLIMGKAEVDAQGKRMMPVYMSVNHALMDGSHLGQFFEGFQRIAHSF